MRQRTIFRIAAGIVLVAIVYIGINVVGNDDGSMENVDVEINNVRITVLEEYPEILNLQPLQKALYLLDLVHNEVKYGKRAWNQFEDLDGTLFDALYSEGSHLCQGLSFIYMTALRAFGIDSRYVGMFRTNVDAPTPVRSHASVEALIDSHWIAFDPTHNFTIRTRNGTRIGWASARDEYLAGRIIQFSNEGSRPGRHIHDDWDSEQELMDLMKFMVLGPSRLSEPEALPDRWDGQIVYLDGTTFNTMNYTGVYSRLAAK